MVSIITPSLNRGILLEHTLRSIKSQSYRHIEHIVVDGASTDITVEILRKYDASYELHWISEPDRGMYQAINKGLRLARGDIVAYLNSDDMYFPWTVEVIVDAFRRYPRADFVYGDVISINDDTRSQTVKWQYPFDLDFIRRVGFLAQPAVFWRREVTEAISFDEGLRYVADCDFWMRAGERHAFVKINETVAVERDHSATLRARNMSALLAELEEVRSRYVTLSGRRHRVATARHRIRTALIRRAYWLSLGVNGMLPRNIRASPWRRFLSMPGIRTSLGWAVVAIVPKIGFRLEGRVLGRSEYLPGLID